MSDIERLVLEKHQLLQHLQEVGPILVALALQVAEGKDSVKLTKQQLDMASEYSVEVVEMSYGKKLKIRKIEQ